MKTKRFLRKLTVFITIIAISLSATCINAQAATQTAQQKEMRGVWFSYIDWQKYLKGKNAAQFDAAFTQICDNIKLHGCNTIFLHVRSHNDAVYPSAIYPWSTEMLNGNPGFDPLQKAVTIAHAKGLALHAWINPHGYRNGSFAGEPSLVTPANILAGINEILNGYAVDGIHFDDYFPPFGKEYHNALIKQVYQTVHAKGKVFGISPQGNLDNNRAGGVDVDTWLSQKGYVDYLCPQIYWTNRYGKSGKTTLYNNRLLLWHSLNKAGVTMYVGLAGYRAGQKYSYDPGWSLSNTNLLEQVHVARLFRWNGYILFSYASMNDPVAATEYYNLLTLLAQ